jgi:hypothetical protein
VALVALKPAAPSLACDAHAHVVTPPPLRSCRLAAGESDWTYEAWVYYTGYSEGTAESPVFQWGYRPGTSCDSGFTSLGSNPTYGAGGNWNCDFAWSASANTQSWTTDGVTGYRPTPFVWHHVALAYTGQPADV